MKYIVVFLLVSSVFLSCNHRNNKALCTTDSLLQVIDQTDTLIAALSHDTAQQRFTSMKKEVELISTLMNVLPENQEHRRAVSEYANISKGFKRVFHTLESSKTENLYNRNQVATLKADIENNALSEEECIRFVQEERMKTEGTAKQVSEVTEKYQRLCTEAALCYPVVTQVIDSLKKAGQIP